MYKEFYGLKEMPFNVTSDPNYLYYSSTHKEALSHLLYGISQKKGFIAVTGEIGAGKTTLCRSLINRLDHEGTKTAYIFNPSLSGVQLLEAILEDFGVSISERKNKISLFKTLNRFLLDQLAHGNNVVLIIDEAQNIKKSLLEEIRMLSNLETEKEKLFQIVLVGQPQLNKKLNAPELIQLKQRIAVRFHVNPLQKEEVKAYIYHRLKVAGSSGDIAFSDDAIEAIYEYSKGIPRIINVLCDRCLLFGYAKATKLIDGEIVRTAISEIDFGTHLPDVALCSQKGSES